MPKAFTSWKVLAHEPIQKLAEDLWWVRGSLPGMSLKRVMTVVRQSDGRLVIHNAIALDDPGMRELEGWGTPTTLVVPSNIHRLDAQAYKQRYPAMKVFAPRGSRKAVEEVVPVDGNYEDYPGDGQVRLEPLRGVGDMEGVMLVTSADGGVTVVLNDAVFNMDRKRDPLGFIFTTVMGSAPGPRVSRLAKMMLVKDKGALKSELHRLAALPGLQRVVVAHENVAHGPAAAATLLEAATYL